MTEGGVQRWGNPRFVSKVIRRKMTQDSTQPNPHPSDAPVSYPWRQAGLGMLVLLVIAGLRRPAVWMSAQFWAEDASVFFVQADVLGWKALTIPHADYHHLLMRLWAGLWINEGAPVLWMPMLFMAGAVVAWLAVVVVFAPSSRVRWPWTVVVMMAVVSPSNEMYF